MGWDFSLSEAIGALVKTAPFLVVRMLVYFGIACSTSSQPDPVVQSVMGSPRSMTVRVRVQSTVP